MSDTEKNKSGKARKIIGIVLNVILYVFFALCVVMLVITLLGKKDAEGAVSFFGHQMRIVVSPSMEKCDQTDVSGYKIKDIPVRSMVFIEEVPENAEEKAAWYGELKTGDVLTFKYVYTRQEVITHRITSIEQKASGGYVIKLAGDNKNDESGVLTQTIHTDDEYSFNYVIGKVTYTSHFIGLVMYILRQPVGLVCVIIIPCAIMIIWQAMRIVFAVSAERKEKAEAQSKQQSDEIAELKKQLAMLKDGGSGGEATAGAEEPAPDEPLQDKTESVDDQN